MKTKPKERFDARKGKRAPGPMAACPHCDSSKVRRVGREEYIVMFCPACGYRYNVAVHCQECVRK